MVQRTEDQPGPNSRRRHCPLAYLADSAVPARLHVVLALVAGVDEAVLALGVQLHQHAQCGPLGPAQGGELPVLVSGEGEEGVTPVHEVTAEQGVRVHDGGQCVDDGPSVQVDHKEDLQGRTALAHGEPRLLCLLGPALSTRPRMERQQHFPLLWAGARVVDSQQPLLPYPTDQEGAGLWPESPPPPPEHLYLFVLLHRGVELLGQVVGHVGHAGLLLVGSTDAAFILVGFLIVLLLGVLAVALAALKRYKELSQEPSLSS